MNVGDLVRRKDGWALRSGCYSYDYAVVISLQPFALASTSGDMLWQYTEKAENFEVVCRACNCHLDGAMRRLLEVKSK